MTTMCATTVIALLQCLNTGPDAQAVPAVTSLGRLLWHHPDPLLPATSCCNAELKVKLQICKQSQDEYVHL